MSAPSPQNLIAQSQSGTGKTAAFVLAMLSRVEPENKYPQVTGLAAPTEASLGEGPCLVFLASWSW